MSTERSGDAKLVDEAVRDAKRLVADAHAEEGQLSLLDPVTPEDIWEAREVLGPAAERLAVLQEARRRKGGRPKGARNKRTDDFARYILGFGQHPAITMMQIQNTAPEVLMEASKHEKVHSFQKNGTPNVVVEHMTYGDAQALRVRCAEGLLPYIESKKPVAVDMSFAGLSDLIIEGVTHSQREIDDIMEAEFLPAPDDDAAIDAGDETGGSDPA